MAVKDGIARYSADAFGDILQAPGGAVLASGMVSSAARDSGSSPTTYLRAGLVLSKLSSGLLKEFGENITEVTAEAVGTGNGTVKEFDLDYSRVVPFSETVKLAGVTQTKDAYEIDYFAGTIRFKVAVANLAAVTADYAHIDYDVTYGYVTDGTEIPYCVLADAASLLDEEGVVQHTSVRIILGGQIKLTSLVVNKTKAATYADYYLSRHGFFGINDIEY